jgi:uncharacterized protein (TIGR00645 family)
MAAKRPVATSVEHRLEWLIFHSRWLMAPFYLGLAVALLILLVHFVMQFVTLAGTVMHLKEAELILGVLSLIDLTFTGNLVLIVVFSGYENFVSRIDVETHDRPDWMTKVDFGGLKQKLMTSIVAISAVQVLKGFMKPDELDTTRLGWIVGIHVVFLFSMLVVVVSDRLAEPLQHPEEKPK